jgi:hypothetical protein
MTMQERRDIFAKEVLTIEDFQKLYGMTQAQASKMMGDIRKKLIFGKGQELRLDMKGKLHTEDYLDWVGVRENRYSIEMEEEEDEGA